MNLRDTRVGAVLIAVLVAAGVWYAKRPEAVQRTLTQLHFGIESQNPNSSVYVRRVSWSPDSRKLLSVTHGEAGLDGSLVLHDLDDRPHRLSIDISGESVANAMLAPDGRHVLVATHEGRLWWIGLESDARTSLLELPRGVGLVAAALSANGRQVAAASSDGSIYLGDPEHQPAAVFASGLRSRISDMRFSKDGCRLVCAAKDGWLCIWELQSGKVQQRWKGHDEPAMAAAFLPGDRIISASLDDTIRIWGISTGQEIWRGEFGLFRVYALALSADGKMAAWGGHQQKIVVWDLEHARKKYEIQIPASIVWDLQFSPDNMSLAIAGTEGMLRVYDAPTGTEKESIEVGQRL